MKIKKYFKILKEVHFHTGLFISPFIIIFSISVLVLNHNFIDWQEDWQKWVFSVDDKVDMTITYTIPDTEQNEIDFAKEILTQLKISGEIANIIKDSTQIYIPVTKPGYRISIKADLLSGLAYVHSERTNIWKKLIWLHKMPGPHNANIRGNWNYTRFWSSLVDFSVVCLFISSITGVIIWYNLKNKRKTGAIALVIGFLSLTSLIFGLLI